MKHRLHTRRSRAVWLVATLGLLVSAGTATPQLLKVSGAISTDRGLGLGELRSDSLARHGDIAELAVAPGESVYIESFHQGGDSGGIALGGDSAGIWSPADTGAIIVFIEEDGPTTVAQIGADGAYAQLGDMRLNREIRPVSSQDLLERLLRLEAKTYKFAYGGENLAKSGAYLERDHIGLIAQDLEAVFPSVVTNQEATDLKMVDYHQLIAILVEAVKALDARIEVLERTSKARDLAPVER